MHSDQKPAHTSHHLHLTHQYNNVTLAHNLNKVPFKGQMLSRQNQGSDQCAPQLQTDISLVA